MLKPLLVCGSRYSNISWSFEPGFAGTQSGGVATASKCSGCTIIVNANGYMFSDVRNLSWIEKEVYLVVDADTGKTSTASVRTNGGSSLAGGLPDSVQKEMYNSLSKTDCISPTSTATVSGTPYATFCKTSRARNYLPGTASEYSVGPNLTMFVFGYFEYVFLLTASLRFSPTTYLGVFGWQKYENRVVTVSGTQSCTQRIETLSNTGMTLFPAHSSSVGWLISGGEYDAESIGSLPTEVYSIVPGWETCDGFGDGVPITNAVVTKLTRTYLTTIGSSRKTELQTTSVLESPKASPASGLDSPAGPTSVTSSITQPSQTRGQPSAGPSFESQVSPTGDFDQRPSTSPGNPKVLSSQDSLSSSETNAESGGQSSATTEPRSPSYTPSGPVSTLSEEANRTPQLLSSQALPGTSTVSAGLATSLLLSNAPGSSTGPPAGQTTDSGHLLQPHQDSVLVSSVTSRTYTLRGSIGTLYGTTVTFPGDSHAQQQHSYVVFSSSTVTDNDDGNYVIDGETIIPGAPAVTLPDGHSVSIASSASLRSQSSLSSSVTDQASQSYIVLASNTYYDNSAGNFVFFTQTYTPGAPAITATLTVPYSAGSGREKKTQTETISFGGESSTSSPGNPSGSQEPYDKGAINAVMTWQHHIYTFYGDGKKNENVVSGHTLSAGGSSVTVNGQTFWLDTNGRLYAQYSPTDSGTLPIVTSGLANAPVGGVEGPGTTIGNGAQESTIDSTPAATSTSAARSRRETFRFPMWRYGLCVTILVFWHLLA